MNQVIKVDDFHELITTPYSGEKNAICWARHLHGNFQEIVDKIVLTEDVQVIDKDTLLALALSTEGQLARDIILNDLTLLTDYGAAPILNVIRNYERDDAFSFFPTDVYSFHVDRSPIPSDTFLCTYYGASSEILPNDQAVQKILIPEIRAQLQKIYDGNDADFEAFLIENFFDLHYQVLDKAQPISLGQGHIWRLAIDHPDSHVLPCVHRAPLEHKGECRLLLIC